uniref:VHS domain-containing protein n=1 Tax=Monodon monoceros TaxID=40151 RepID=A0A8C6BYR4_MONMO
MALGKSHRNPFATSMGQHIENATVAGLQTEHWGQFMHICDIINTVHDGPKDAIKALKKRISKNYNHKSNLPCHLLTYAYRTSQPSNA